MLLARLATEAAVLGCLLSQGSLVDLSFSLSRRPAGGCQSSGPLTGPVGTLCTVTVDVLPLFLPSTVFRVLCCS